MTKRRALIRLALGFLQMTTASAGLWFLFSTGVSAYTIWAFVLSTSLTIASLYLFRFRWNTQARQIISATEEFLDMKKLIGEFFGTFALVFAGTGAITINEVSGGAVTHVGIALTFGLVVMAMIYAFGDVSGAHMNPAVTTGFALAGRFLWRDVPRYVASQVLGALAASGLLRLLFPANERLGATLPAGPAWQSFVLEFVLTLLLMLVILSVSTGAKEKGIMAGAAIGAVIGLEALFAGPICGASMNPARSLAPALVSGYWEHLWVYLLAPTLGAGLAVPACCIIRERGCCCAPSLTT